MLSRWQRLLWLALLFSPLLCRADELWTLLQQGRPVLARQRIRRLTPLQRALVAHQGTKALECIVAAQSLYAASANSRDQRAASDCQLLRAYFLLRSQRPSEALALCRQSKGPWFTFLSGRSLLALGQNAEAEVAFAGCNFEEGLAQVGSLVYRARGSSQADDLYEQAY